MNKLRKNLDEYYLKYGFKKKVDCPADENSIFELMVKEEKELPINVYEHVDDSTDHSYRFYRVSDTDISPEEMLDYISLKQLSYIGTIKNCAIFFVSVFCISVAIGVISILSLIN